MRLIDAEPLEEILRLRRAQCNNDYGSLAGAISGCLKLVQVQPTVTQSPNEPLTLEQLREMDGEPVWNDTIMKWMLIDLTWEYGEHTVDAGGDWRGLDDRYYRRRPEAQP